jgi:hypothetical protein
LFVAGKGRTEEGGYGWPREARQGLRRRDGVGGGDGKGGEGVRRGGVGQARVSRVEERGRAGAINLLVYANIV